MAEQLPMTTTGYNKIKEQVLHMENEEMPKIAQRIADARAEGDLKENAEYHGARESQGMLQAKINLLKDKLARAAIIDTSKLPKDEVAFSATVTLLDLEYDDEEVYVLVGAGEEDYDSGRILANSPLGKTLLGQKVGDEVEFQGPKKLLKFKILKIEYLD